MSITVRVQNFQSILDQTVVVDGFTVITGPNNSGKTALLRAIQGVFTNAPAGPLVRHGASHLTVDIDFGDGNRVRWEKGEKINRYTVNGKLLDNVGRGVPPEVAALGLSEIKAGSDRLWPNFAQQFGGVLFLVDRPGSVVAEALSDVDKVGRLTDALRAAESDKRSVLSDLKIRRKDAEDLKKQASQYDGLDNLLTQISEVEELRSALEDIQKKVGFMEQLQSRISSQKDTVLRLSPVAGYRAPEYQSAEDLRKSIGSLAVLQSSIATHKRDLSRLKPVLGFALPKDPSPIHEIKRDLQDKVSLRSRLAQASKEVGLLSGVSTLSVPDGFKASAQLGVQLRDARKLQSRLTQARKELLVLAKDIETKQGEAEAAEQAVHDLLGEHGECPICHTTFDAGSPHA